MRKSLPKQGKKKQMLGEPRRYRSRLNRRLPGSGDCFSGKSEARMRENLQGENLPSSLPASSQGPDMRFKERRLLESARSRSRSQEVAANGTDEARTAEVKGNAVSGERNPVRGE